MSGPGEYLLDQQIADTNFESGAVRSGDAANFSFTSLPWVGLLGVARTGGEGTTKYGRYNYMLGMPVHDLLEHVLKHQAMFILGDRSEPHLEHAAWGLLAAIQSYTLEPELSSPHLLGPGATITSEVKAFLDANAADLKEKRAAGVFSGIGGWDLRSIPEVARLLIQREALRLDREAVVQVEADNAAAREAAKAEEDFKALVAVCSLKLKKPRRTKAQIAADNAAKEAVYETVDAVAEMLAEGLDQASRGELVAGPDLDADAAEWPDSDTV